MRNRNYPFARSLKQVLRAHNHTLSPTDRTRQQGKRVASGTANRRSQVLWQVFRQLWDAGYELRDVHNFRQKHLDALLDLWLGAEPPLSAGTLQTRFSVLRAFGTWIGKPGLVPPTRKLFADPEKAARVRRATVAAGDRSWSARGVSVEDVLEEVAARDRWVAIQIALQAYFGLRVKESAHLNPRLDDHGDGLLVRRGTKNGLSRWVRIETPEQRRVLDQAKAMVPTVKSSLIPRRYTWERWQDHYYYIVRAVGVTRRQLGVTSHGLRHERLNDEYEKLTGHPSPVRGGQIADAEADRAARHRITQIAGHNRIDVVSCYAGSARVPSTKVMARTNKDSDAGERDGEPVLADGDPDEESDATGGEW